jgi:hypothetical protein
MGWTHLLPEPGREPEGLVPAGTGPLEIQARIGGPLPADPSTVTPAEALYSAYKRRPGVGKAVRAWPTELRRRLALLVHLDAYDDSREIGAPDPWPAHMMPILIDDTMRWSRSDLAWALRTADGYLMFDGAAYLLPGYIGASLSRAELDGFEPALTAVFDEFINERKSPRAVRKLLGGLYGTAIGRCTGRLPLDLLTPDGPFGRFVGERFGGRLDEPGVTELLRHAASLEKSAPSKTWLRTAAGFPVTWPVAAVLDCLADYHGYVRFGDDDLLRGLAWILALDPSGEADVVLGRLTVAAGSCGPFSPGYPFAPRTATAGVKILAGRPGDAPRRALEEFSRRVVNKALSSRVHKALEGREA